MGTFVRGRVSSAPWSSGAFLQAADKMVKRPNIDNTPGTTDEACCEHEDCQAWPHKYKEAPKGCEAADIHDDCQSLRGSACSLCARAAILKESLGEDTSGLLKVWN